MTNPESKAAAILLFRIEKALRLLRKATFCTGDAARLVCIRYAINVLEGRYDD